MTTKDIENIIDNTIDSTQLLDTNYNTVEKTSKVITPVSSPSHVKPSPIKEDPNVLQQISAITDKQQNLSTILNKLGYEIVQQVVHKSNQLPQIEMLKCFHQNNELVYIVLDTNGYLINNTAPNVEIIKVSQENNIPLSLKENSIQIMSYDVSGIVFENEECLVLLHRDKKTSNLLEKTYHLDITTNNTTFNIFPMVYFSEIQSYPQLVCQNCTNVSAQLTTCVYKEYCIHMKEMNKSMINLAQVWQSFITLNHSYQQKLFETINKLNEHKRTNCNPKLECAINKSLKEKHNMLHDYLSMLHSITEMNSATSQIGFNIYTVEKRLKNLEPLIDTIEY